MKKIYLFVVGMGILFSACSQGNSFWFVEYPEYPSSSANTNGWDGPGLYTGTSWFEIEDEFLQWRAENRARTSHLWENRSNQKEECAINEEVLEALD